MTRTRFIRSVALALLVIPATVVLAPAQIVIDPDAPYTAWRDLGGWCVSECPRDCPCTILPEIIVPG